MRSEAISPHNNQSEIPFESRTSIDHLVVIAGPEAAGKSTLMRGLRGNYLTELKKRLGTQDLETWQRVTLSLLRKPQSADLSSLVLFECNLLSAHCRQLDYVHDTPLMQLLDRARTISIVTLWTPPERLRRQRIERDIKRIRKSLPTYGYRRVVRFGMLYLVDKILQAPLKGMLSHYKIPRRILTLLCGRYFSFYLLPDEVIRCYDNWFRFSDSLKNKTLHHYIAELNAGHHLCSRHEWNDLVSKSRNNHYSLKQLSL